MSDISLLDENSPCADQPNNLKLQLKPHQLKSLYQCNLLETTDIIENDNTRISTSIGILCDKSGSGKSHIILGLLVNNPILKKEYNRIHKSDLFNVFESIDNTQIDPNFKQINILIVNDNKINQWKNFITNDTNLNLAIGIDFESKADILLLPFSKIKLFVKYIRRNMHKKYIFQE